MYPSRYNNGILDNRITELLVRCTQLIVKKHGMSILEGLSHLFPRTFIVLNSAASVLRTSRPKVEKRGEKGKVGTEGQARLNGNNSLYMRMWVVVRDLEVIIGEAEKILNERIYFQDREIPRFAG